MAPSFDLFPNGGWKVQRGRPKGWFEMERFMNMARRVAGKTSIVRDERGLTTVEYVIILVLIAIVAIGVWSKFGQAVQDKVTHSRTQIEQLGPDSSSGDR